MGANLQNADLLGANLQNVNLEGVNLQNDYLGGANLQDASLLGANLQNANLEGANLQDANLLGVNNLTFGQIKSACFWEKAIYIGNWNNEKPAFVAKEPDNSNYIKKLKSDRASNPKEKPDCSRWEN